MNKSAHKLKDAHVIYEIDQDNRCIYSYDQIDEVILRPTLKSVNSDLAAKLEEYFNISIEEYGVTIENEVVIMPKEALSKAVDFKVGKILASVFIVLILLMLFYTHNEQEHIQQGINYLGYITLAGAVLLLFISLGGEYNEEKRLNSAQKYNTTLVDLPTSPDEMVDLKLK